MLYCTWVKYIDGSMYSTVQYPKVVPHVGLWMDDMLADVRILLLIEDHQASRVTR